MNDQKIPTLNPAVFVVIYSRGVSTGNSPFQNECSGGVISETIYYDEVVSATDYRSQ